MLDEWGYGRLIAKAPREMSREKRRQLVAVVLRRCRMPTPWVKSLTMKHNGWEALFGFRY